MNSSTSRTLEKQKEQDDIRRQIELLKAKLVKTDPEPELEGSRSTHPSSISKPSFHPRPITNPPSSTPTTKPSTSSTQTNPLFSTPHPSTLFSSLRRLEKATHDDSDSDSNGGKQKVERTVGFDDKPQRDDRLALIEDFEMGPYEFTPPVGDPTFKAFEPHSGIALSYVSPR